MATSKITMKDYFNGAIAFVKGEDTQFTADDLVEFFEGRIAVLEKKSANRKTKVNEGDEELKAAALDVLSNVEEPITVSAMMKANERLGAESNQKISAILRKMIAEGTVKKDKDKKSTVFSLVTE